MKAAAAAVMLLMMPAGVVAEPKVLSDFELDAITATGILVDVNSFASASGDLARTFTDARTVAFGGEWFDLGVGVTLGHGFACCGEEADVKVGSAVVGVGDIVRRGTQAIEQDDGFLAQALSAGYVVALSLNKPLLMLRELRPALADVRSGLRASAAE